MIIGVINNVSTVRATVFLGGYDGSSSLKGMGSVKSNRAGAESRAQGSLLGQIAGDSLGSLVEFQSPSKILKSYPLGPRELEDGGVCGTLAGQPTDDSEMALELARTILEYGGYNPGLALDGYRAWLDSGPFDCGTTILDALNGKMNPASEANGAMMRASPLGIFGAGLPEAKVAALAIQDAALTHPNPVCQQSNALFVLAISNAISTGASPAKIYERILGWCSDFRVDKTVWDAVRRAESLPPADFMRQQGWVLIAFQNAIWQILHAPSFEDALVDTVMRGGDTDTNAAICGALLGAVHGVEAVPARWRDAVLNCRPAAGAPSVRRPRPERYWPVDAVELADGLLAAVKAA